MSSIDRASKEEPPAKPAKIFLSWNSSNLAPGLLGRTGGSGKQQSQNYYTDDTPGLKISPVRKTALGLRGLVLKNKFECVSLILTSASLYAQVVVIGMSIGFIIFVTALHIYGKVGSSDFHQSLHGRGMR